MLSFADDLFNGSKPAHPLQVLVHMGYNCGVVVQRAAFACMAVGLLLSLESSIFFAPHGCFACFQFALDADTGRNYDYTMTGDRSTTMKQNGTAIRLVQRKFAQGVPVPASHVAPPPPERKADLPKERKTVYHSRMSAKNFLDIVSLQNVHRHKQPMVLLERLRVNDIPTSSSPILVRKRLNPKAKKNSMCLRPRDQKLLRKRKNEEIKKEAPLKKRSPLKKKEEMSSATEDDTPLLYLKKKSPRKPPDEGRRNSTIRFKRPKDKSVMRYLKLQKMQKSVHLANGHERSPSQVAPARRSARRATCAAGPEPPTHRALRPRLLSTDSHTGRSRSGHERSPSQVAPARRSARRATCAAGPEPPTHRALRPRLLSTDSHTGRSRSDKLKVKRLRPYPENVGARGPLLRGDRNICYSCFAANPALATRNRPAISQPPAVAVTPILNVPAPVTEPPRAPSPEPCPSKLYKSVHEVVTAATSFSPKLDARCGKCRDCDIVNKILELKDLVRSEGVNQGAIYDSNTELEEAICPSLSTQRSRRRLSRSAGEHIYLDILPPDTPHILQILCKTTVDKRTVSAVRVVDRDVAFNAEHPTLAEQENLLDQLLACMSRRAQQTDDEDPTETVPMAKPAKSIKNKPTGEHASFKAPATNGMHVDTTKPESPDQPVLQPGRPLPGPPQTTKPASGPLPGPSESQQTAAVASDVFKLPNEPIAKPPVIPAMDADMESVIGRDAPAGTVVDAPVFHPTAAEFTDPIEYYKKIRPYGSKYGLCKIVPPDGFTPPCVLDDHIRFAVIYQYISKLYNRWGPVARELAAIKVLLRTQKVVFTRAPLLNGCEVNLPKLYHAVERQGGLTKVIHRKRWGRVAEDMKLANLQKPENKLDKIYMRFLLPYATLSDKERQGIMTKVERYWTTTKYKKMLARARKPLHAQNRLLGASDSSSDEGDGDTAGALEEAEDCITQGRSMNLGTFRKVAKSFMEAQFPSGRPETAEVERAYWRAILLGTDHIVANTASIDTGEEGHGFPKDPAAPYGTHPWNLKMLASNPGNVLRFLGPVLGVTVPTLHLSMLYSTCCWHRDPHGLPWVEYLHTGPDKIWYGIPSSQSNNFRRAVETLCPAYCQNKSIWLASDIAMIPPEILSEHGVALSRVEQRPGEFVMVFPEAHSCSVTTGFSVSESVYFAPNSWLDTVYKLFQELRSSCEPTMFSLEQLLLNGAERAGGAAARVLGTLLSTELRHRAELEARGVPVVVLEPSSEQPSWTTDECEYCRASLYLSKVVGVSARRAPLCPEHALLLLSRARVDAELELRSSYSTTALHELLARLPRGSVDA